MAQDTSDQFSQLWQRHLTVLRDDFSATSIQALPSLPSCDRSIDGEYGQHRAPDEYPSHVWDEKVISVHVVDALEELAPSVSPQTIPGVVHQANGVAQTESYYHRHAQPRDALVSRQGQIHRDDALLARELQLAKDSRDD